MVSSLKRDVRSSHANQPLFSCDQCGRSFNRADNLHTHMRNCTGHCVVVPTVVVPTVAVPTVAVPTVAVPAAKKRCTGVAPER